MRAFGRVIGAAILSLIVLGGALPVAARTAGSTAASYRPDGRIRLQMLTSSGGPPIVYSKPWIGNNIYNTTGVNQKAKAILKGSAFSGWNRWTFGVSAQNDGTSGDRFWVHATGTNLMGWTVKYFHGTTNITAGVVNGTFKTPTVAPGDQYLIEARVKVDFDHGFAFDPFHRMVTLTSTHSNNTSDTVKLVVKPEACGC